MRREKRDEGVEKREEGVDICLQKRDFLSKMQRHGSGSSGKSNVCVSQVL